MKHPEVELGEPAMTVCCVKGIIDRHAGRIVGHNGYELKSISDPSELGKKHEVATHVDVKDVSRDKNL